MSEVGQNNVRLPLAQPYSQLLMTIFSTKIHLLLKKIKYKHIKDYCRQPAVSDRNRGSAKGNRNKAFENSFWKNN
ncbi:hypothetical protein [Nostoc sp.]|uniref:hypothetical protein n=1 Tax=Nostoc sp. TaxID=1180 RepID=UPI002FF7918B